MSYNYPDQDLDLTLLHEIADGSDEFIIESIGMFLQQTPGLVNEISNLIAQGDWPNAGTTAHKLKPTLGFFGMLSTQALVQQVEHACKAGGENPQEITDKFNQVKVALATNMTTLYKIKVEKTAGL